jgi:uncharacterized protein
MIHPFTQVRYIGPEIGHGVFATALIPKGTITWAPDPLDREYTPESFMALPPLVREAATTYSYRNQKGNYILPWDHTRYVNHSCHANTMLTPYGFELAINDIFPGDEITNDYGTLNIIEPFEPCDVAGARSVVRPDDIARLYTGWDEWIHEALRLVSEVDQPLIGLIPEEAIERVKRVNAGLEERLSIRGCLFQT